MKCGKVIFEHSNVVLCREKIIGSDSTTIIRARDVMHKGIVSIDGMATAKEAAAKMRSEKSIIAAC